MTHGEGRQGRFVLANGSSEPISNLELPRGNVRRLQDLLQLGRAGGTTTPSANPGAGAGATESSPAAPEGAFQRQLKVKPQAAKRAKTTLKADGNRKSPVWAGSTAGAQGLEGSEVAVTALLLAPDSGSRPVWGEEEGRKSTALLLAPRGAHPRPFPQPRTRGCLPSPRRCCPNVLDSQSPSERHKTPVSASAFPRPHADGDPESCWERGRLPGLLPPTLGRCRGLWLRAAPC